MFRFLLKTISNAFRVWIRDTFYRDAFLKSQFDDLHSVMLDNINKALTGQEQKDAGCFEILGMMPTASIDTRLSDRDDKDSCVIFCLYNMSMDDFDRIFGEDYQDWWKGTGIDQVRVFRAITSHDFKTRCESFAKSEFGQSIKPDTVKMIVDEYTRIERESATYVMTIWTIKGNRPRWLQDKLNILKDTPYCLRDAKELFDLDIDNALIVQQTLQARNSE
jgi:hypothetical protein